MKSSRVYNDEHDGIEHYGVTRKSEKGVTICFMN